LSAGEPGQLGTLAEQEALRSVVRKAKVLAAGTLVIIGAMGALLVAVLSPQEEEIPLRDFLAQASRACLAIDVSGSMQNPRDAAFVQGFFGVVAQLPEEHGIGLVPFAVNAYPMWDLGGSPLLFGALLRQFDPVVLENGRETIQPYAWKEAVDTNGTIVSAGLERCLTMLRQTKDSNGAIILVSDLATAGSDRPKYGELLREIRESGYAIYVVAVNARSEDRAFAKNVAGDNAFVFEVDKDAFLKDLAAYAAKEDVDSPESTEARAKSSRIAVGAVVLITLVSGAVLVRTTRAPWARTKERGDT
jgi:hypothetical protein